MASIYLRLSNKADKITSKSEILIRFKHGAVDLRTKSGIYVHSKNWDNDKQKIIIPNSRIKNPLQIELVECDAKLTELTSIIMNEFLNADHSQVDREWLDVLVDNYNHPDRVKEPEEKSQTFFEAFDEFIDTHKLSEVRKRNFKVVFRALQRYEIYTTKTNKRAFRLDLNTIADATLRDIEKFLYNEYLLVDQYPEMYKAIPESRRPQPRGQNTINDIFTKLRTFILWSNNADKTNNNPFKHFSIEECVYGTPYYITIDERNKLYRTNLNRHPKLAIQRDIFVFQCLIGCRVGDLYKMTKASVINGAIEYIPRKTKDGRPITVRVPLNTIALEILSKYQDVEGNKLFPFISEQKYNVAIKRMFLGAGLTRMVTIVNPTTREEEKRPLNEIASSHLARRCFVGNLYKKVKDPNLVGALSGHKEGSKAFARYREIDEDMKNELVKMLE